MGQVGCLYASARNKGVQLDSVSVKNATWYPCRQRFKFYMRSRLQQAYPTFFPIKDVFRSNLFKLHHFSIVVGWDDMRSKTRWGTILFFCLTECSPHMTGVLWRMVRIISLQRAFEIKAKNLCGPWTIFSNLGNFQLCGLFQIPEFSKQMTISKNYGSWPAPYFTGS